MINLLRITYILVLASTIGATEIDSKVKLESIKETEDHQLLGFLKDGNYHYRQWRRQGRSWYRPAQLFHAIVFKIGFLNWRNCPSRILGPGTGDWLVIKIICVQTHHILTHQTLPQQIRIPKHTLPRKLPSSTTSSPSPCSQ